MFKRHSSGNRRITSQRRISFMELEQKISAKASTPLLNAQSQQTLLHKSPAAQK